MLAVPGEITAALSAGSNALLRLGATPLIRYEDALESFGIMRIEPPPPKLEPAAAAVLERIRAAAVGVDELARATSLGAAEVAVAITELELAGLVSVEEGLVRATG